MTADEARSVLETFFFATESTKDLQRAKEAVKVLCELESMCCESCRAQVERVRTQCLGLVKSLEAQEATAAREADSQLTLFIREGSHDKVLSVPEGHGVGRE